MEEIWKRTLALENPESMQQCSWNSALAGLSLVFLETLHHRRKIILTVFVDLCSSLVFINRENTQNAMISNPEYTRERVYAGQQVLK